MIRIILLVIVLVDFALFGCSPNKTEETNTESTHVPFDTIKGERLTQIFEINWKSFFTKAYDTSQLRYLVPTDFLIRDNNLIIPNKVLDRVDIFDFGGQLIRSLNYRGYDIDAAKIHLTKGMDTLFILDLYRGLYVIDPRQGLLHQDEKTIDFFTTDTGNIFFQNALDRNSLEIKSAYLDVNGILREPLVKNYSAAYFEDNLFIGIDFPEKAFHTPFVVDKYDLRKGQSIIKTQPDTICTDCFKFPKFLSRNLIVATNDEIGKDQLYTLSDDGKIELKETLNLPEEFVPLSAAEYVSQTYSGFCYRYDSKPEILYIMGSDKNGIRVFRYSL
jgi:hypothetical protein